MHKKNLVATIAAFFLISAAFAQAPPAWSVQGVKQMKKQHMATLKIRITANGKALMASLADNPTAKDFHSMLPLTLTLNDYAATEKISYLPRKLSNEGAPGGVDPEIGDIAYYAPWGNLAIFYKDFGYSNGLIKLGTIDTDLDALKVPGSVKIVIEPIGK